MATGSADAPVPARKARRRALLAAAAVGGVVALALVIWAFVVRHRSSGSPSPDPRAAFTGPWRNVSPTVAYVAEDRCAECHADLARSFAEHPMGRSLRPLERAALPPEDERHHNPFVALGSRFEVGHDGGRVRHRRTQLDARGQPVPGVARDWDIHYDLGSGARGHSYLSDRDGYLLLSPISWYSQKEIWDLQPGNEQALRTGRPVLPDCLFCHANRAEPVPGTVNRYAEPVFRGHAIGCQRCHGPGELHAAAPQRADPDPTIVNPRHLEPSLRNAVCEQCHLVGVGRVVRRGRGLYDFRPGMPLGLFWAAFVRPPAARGGARAVDHVGQMYQSRCFRDSAGPSQLGCTSCHDPHRAVPAAERQTYYRARCLTCHEGHGCGLAREERLRQSPSDSCIDCHMTRYRAADIPHTAATDHRIPRRPAEPADGPAGPAGGDELLPVPFYRPPPGGEPEAERDLGMVVVDSVLAGNPAYVRAVGRVLAGLGAAVRRDPDDLAAGEAYGYALALENRPDEARAAFEAVLARDGGRELALAGAASMAEDRGRAEAARGYWRRAVAANPWMTSYRRRLALLLVKEKNWEQARPECDAWVRLDPLSAEARAARLACLVAVGDRDEARAEFARLEGMAPKNFAELRARFGKKLK